MSSSESDTEFFDAREVIGSPRSDASFVLEKTSDDSVQEDIDLIKADTAPTVSCEGPSRSEDNVEDGPDSHASPGENDQDYEQQLPPSSADIVRSTCSGTVPKRNLTLERQPDLLACLQERPTNLPGVKPVDVVVPEEQQATPVNDKDETPISETKPHVHEPSVAAASSAVAENFDAKEILPAGDAAVTKKKIPPPRPPAPPKRPPPPKKHLGTEFGRPGKPYLSVVDDGLLTPNSTVDNLTREFTEALNQATAADQHKKEVVVTESSTKTTHTKRSSSRIPGDTDMNSTHSANARPSSMLVQKEEVSKCLNPLALQIMSRTKEFSYAGSTSSTGSHNAQLSTASAIMQANQVDSDSVSLASDDIEIGKEASSNKHRDGGKKVKKSKKFKKMVGKGVSKVKVVAGNKVEKAVQKVKHVKEEVMHTDALNVSSDEDSTDPSSMSAIKVKASSSNKGPYQFSRLKQVQDIAVHVGAVWCMKFSHCGRLLATAGQDNVIWVWVLKDFYNYFNDMRNKYDSQDELFGGSLRHSVHSTSSGFFSAEDDVFGCEASSQSRLEDDEDDAPFHQVPFSSYVGHSADVLDLAWSKNFFILSSSMDKTVRLWHISRKECLCCFQHIDFVTAIAFHPRDDRYFLSGSLDSKLRLWNIPDKKVALWNEVSPDGSSSSSTILGGPVGGALITTVNFCENGKFAVCGTYDGRCIFFDTEHLKYHTQIHVRSSRGRNTKGHKITGIEPLHGEHKILVTSNDSRVRLYDLRDLSLVCKYKGYTNLSSQIKASFSPDSKYIISGSEDKCVYIWKTSLPQDVTKLSSFRRDRNDCWESLKAHDAVVTCAVFAPQPHLLYKSSSSEASQVQSQPKVTSILSLTSKKQSVDEINVIVSADFNGAIKVIVSGD